MNTTLRPALSRALALALLVGVAAGIYLFGVVPFLSAHAELNRSIENTAERLARLGGVADRSESLKETLDRLEAIPAEEKAYFSGTSVNLLEAELQASMKSIAEDAGGTLKTFQVLPEDTVGPFVQVAVRLTIEGGVEALQSVLYQIEGWQPALFVRRLDVQTQSGRRLRVRASQDQPDELTIRLDVIGFLRPEAS